MACRGARPTRRHCCAIRIASGDWVRPGIMLYGASPFADVSAEQLGLRPAMTLQSEIISVQTLKAGEGVGYGQLFRAERADARGGGRLRLC